MRNAIKTLLLGVALLLLTAASARAASVWQAPLRPLSVTRGFDAPPTPYAAGHRGVDLRGVAGEPVVAAASGLVSYAGPLAGRGVVVVVHGALRTTYEPVRATVRRGMRVTGGERIGVLEVGHVGCPVAACLHWGLLRGTEYLDPLTVLSRPEIRLLPLAGPARSVSPRPTRPPAGTALALPARSLAPGGAGVSPAVSWSAAALAGAGVVMIRRRR